MWRLGPLLRTAWSRAHALHHQQQQHGILSCSGLSLEPWHCLDQQLLSVTTQSKPGLLWLPLFFMVAEEPAPTAGASLPSAGAVHHPAHRISCLRQRLRPCSTRPPHCMLTWQASSHWWCGHVPGVCDVRDMRHVC